MLTLVECHHDYTDSVTQARVQYIFMRSRVQTPVEVLIFFFRHLHFTSLHELHSQLRGSFFISVISFPQFIYIWFIYDLFHTHHSHSSLSQEHANPQLTTPNVSGFIAQLVRASHRYREVTGSNPVEVLNFFQDSLCNCINCVHNWEDHPSFDTWWTRWNVCCLKKLKLTYPKFYAFLMWNGGSDFPERKNMA